MLLRCRQVSCRPLFMQPAVLPVAHRRVHRRHVFMKHAVLAAVHFLWSSRGGKAVLPVFLLCSVSPAAHFSCNDPFFLPHSLHKQILAGTRTTSAPAPQACSLPPCFHKARRTSCRPLFVGQSWQEGCPANVPALQRVFCRPLFMQRMALCKRSCSAGMFIGAVLS